MCSAEELILSDEPGASANVNQQEQVIELYSKELPLKGGNAASPVLIYEGKITYQDRDWDITYLAPHKKTPLVRPLDNNRDKWDMYFIRFPFTLHPTPENRYYKKVVFYVSISDKSVTAYDLFPQEITSKEEVEKSVVIAPEGKFKGVELSLGSYNTTVKSTRLRSDISVFGVSENKFYWRYSSSESNGVLPGVKYALIILKVPHGMRRVNGEIYYEAVMAKQWLGNWRSTDAQSEKRSFAWKLPFP